MKQYVLALLVAATAATQNCVDPDASWTETDESTDVTDADSCKAACVETIAGSTDNDYCCYSQITDADSSIVACALFTKATADADIRADATPVDGDTFTAWAWVAGVEVEDAVEEEVVEEEEEEEEEE